MHVIQSRRERESEVRACEDILGIAAIYRVSRKRRLITQIFHSVMTVPAITIHAAHPGDTDTRSERHLRGRAFDYFADDLMARNELRPNRR